MDNRIRIVEMLSDDTMTKQDIVERIYGGRTYGNNCIDRNLQALRREGIIGCRWVDGVSMWSRTGKPYVRYYTDGSVEVYR